MEILIAWGAFSFLVGMLALSYGRSPFGYFMLSVLLTPLLGLIICLIAGKKTAPVVIAQAAQPTPPDNVTHRRCPECAEWVLREAKKCKHCQAELVPN